MPVEQSTPRIEPILIMQERAPLEPIRSAMFIAGGDARRNGLDGIQNMLKDKFTGDVSVYDGGFFGDTPSAERYTEMADDFKDKVAKGHVNLIGHSLAAADMYKLLHEVGMDYVKEHADNISLTLISPTMPENLLEGVKYAKDYARLGVQEGGMLGRTLPTEAGILQGIVSLATIPPHETLYESLHETVRRQWPNLAHGSQYAEEVERPARTELRDYDVLFDTQTQAGIYTADKRLTIATDMNDARELNRALRARGQATSPVLQQVTDGDYAPHFEQEKLQNTKYPKTEIALKTRNELIKDALVRGNVYDMYDRLADDGLDITIVVPEYDLLMSADDAIRFKGDRPNVTVKVMPFATHSAPWVAQPKKFEKIFDAPGQAA